jgi:hypothetical protein
MVYREGWLEKAFRYDRKKIWSIQAEGDLRYTLDLGPQKLAEVSWH